MLDSNNDSFYGGGGSSNESLEQRMILTKVKATFDAKAREYNELCWDLCIDKAGAKLDEKTAMCLSNCVDRFYDTTKFITERFLQSLQNNNGYSKKRNSNPPLRTVHRRLNEYVHGRK